MRKGNCATFLYLKTMLILTFFIFFIHAMFYFPLHPCKQASPIKENMFVSLNFLFLVCFAFHFQALFSGIQLHSHSLRELI